MLEDLIPIIMAAHISAELRGIRSDALFLCSPVLKGQKWLTCHQIAATSGVGCGRTLKGRCQMELASAVMRSCVREKVP